MDASNRDLLSHAAGPALSGESPVRDRHGSRDREIIRTVMRIVIPLLSTTTTYAILRYNVFGGTSWHQVPLFVFNKAIAWTALTLVCIALSMGALTRLAPHRFGPKLWLRKYIGLSGFFLASLHMVMSFYILNPEYFPRFYLIDSRRMTGLAELTMLCGAVSWMLLLTLAFASLPTVFQNMSRKQWIRWQSLAGLFAAILGGGHVLYGYAGWFRPGEWSGGLPSITLLSALTVAAMLCVRALARTKPDFRLECRDHPRTMNASRSNPY